MSYLLQIMVNRSMRLMEIYFSLYMVLKWFSLFRVASTSSILSGQEITPGRETILPLPRIWEGNDI